MNAASLCFFKKSLDGQGAVFETETGVAIKVHVKI